MKQLNMIRAVVSSHYRVKVDDEQAIAEVVNLYRKQGKGSLDDKAEQLVARLEVATGHSIAELLERKA
jgi:hypothetical protein